MRMEVEGRDSDRFLGQVDAATVALDRAVTTALGVRVELLSFEGPHLTPDHVKLSLFLAALGVLAGSLGGRADSQALVRGVLFIDEET